MKVKKIFSLGLAQDLIKLGHNIIRIEQDKKYDKQVFVFKWSEKLENDFTKIKNEFNNKYTNFYQ